MSTHKKFLFLPLASLLFLSLFPAAVFGETREDCEADCFNKLNSCAPLDAEPSLRNACRTSTGFGPCLTGCELLSAPTEAEPGTAGRQEETGFIGGGKTQLKKTGVGTFGKEEGALAAETPEQRVSTVINAFLSILGIAFLLLTTYGGLIWITARGDETKAEQAKNIITRAVFGLMIIAAAYAFVIFVLKRLI